MNFLFKSILATIFGAALSLTQAPYDLWFLTLPCFAALYYLYQTLDNKKQVFALIFLFAFAYFTTGLYWIGNALTIVNFGTREAILSVGAISAVAAMFSAFYASISYIWLKKDSQLTNLIWFSVFISLSEWVRGYAIFAGFPWNLYGYGLVGSPALAQSLSFMGAYGLTFMSILWGGAIGYVWCRHKGYKGVAAFSIISFALIYAYGHYRLSSNPTSYHNNIEMHITQPNIEQGDKWVKGREFSDFEKHVDLLQLPFAADKQHVVVWPEATIAHTLLNSPKVNKRLQDILGNNGILLSGVVAPRSSDKTKFYNSIWGWSGNSNAEHVFSKSHLVPFGEYIPFAKYIDFPLIAKFAGLQHGQGTATINVDGFPSFSPLICYEIIFPHEAALKHNRPEYIMTIANDAWYGDSSGPYQHFAQARFRAIEQGLPVVRAANTGISGIIDPYGRVIERLELSTRGSIDHLLPKRTVKSTIYARFGDLIYVGLILIAGIFGLFLRVRQRKP